MRSASVLDELSRRTPMVVTAALCAALVGYWTGAPEWLPYGLASAMGGLALIVLATRDRRRRVETETDSDHTDWLAQELAGNGSPAGTYLLGFFGVVTIALTGFQGAYAMPGWAALALTAAWAIANARESSEEAPEG